MLAGLCFGLTLLLSGESSIGTQDAPTDARRCEATAAANAAIKQSGAGQLAPESRGATAAVPQTAAMTIAPAAVIDSGDEMFIGTGDGSNGFWVRP